MKTTNRIVSFVVLGLLFLTSCSTEPEETTLSDTKTEIENSAVYNYSANEIETLDLVNNYRKSIGLNALVKINFISLKSEEHAKYMIANNVVNHNDFVSRSNEIIKVLGARNVSENIAYNYQTPSGAFDAWLKSPSHKENIIGDFTHFGISIRQDAATGKKYYVNIFAKI